MSAPVEILYTVRRADLVPFSDLVFSTLRVGFPNAPIRVTLNGLAKSPSMKVVEALGLEVLGHPRTIHHKWIQELLDHRTEPFWICDTDMIFYESVEAWTFALPLAGRRIPEWHDEFTGCITRSRLHTSLLYLDPRGIVDQLAKFRSQYADTPFNPFGSFVDPICVPFKRHAYFYDTCARLYHAIGGQPFTETQLEAYTHLNFGTIEDLVLPRLHDGKRMYDLRREILADPEKGRGLWRVQDEYYSARQGRVFA